ncbi:carboxylate transporter [Lactobacillus sp. S2-2]|uniref:SLC13 family permease n=1 Tax=Lactobacillus sp. S2-2 TaxID=2692917 RepID=UPI001F39FAF6|nr:SLC13 family permease [Lactobacillus sp. S2-2]MCF6515732.1 carboxylate transporter [Lactobacillus sp. S2-2]
MKLFKYLYNDKILLFTLIITCLTLFFGTPAISSIDWHTIISLTSLLICVELLSETQILNNLSIRISNHASNTKILSLLLITLSFFGSMILTNDVSILVIIPIAIKIFNQIGIKYYFPVTLIIIAANLGSSITPFGNPQNIFLISKYNLTIQNFLKISIPIGIISFILIIISITTIKQNKFKPIEKNIYQIKYSKIFLSLITLLIVLLGIFKIIPILFSLLFTILISSTINYKIFKKIDYRLIVTFILFFIAISNLTNSNLISHLLENLITSNQALKTTGLLLCQVISNVPTTILLSNFTNNYELLYQSVTIGGLGTLIASLANLLALKQIIIYDKNKHIIKFIIYFSFINLIFIISMIIIIKILNI